MIKKHNTGWGVALAALALCLLTAVGVWAQEDQLQLRLRRDFGYGSGNQIQGRFSYRVEAPPDVERVVFYMDDKPIGEATEAPFRHNFQTKDYPAGIHVMSAVGYTADGRELQSNRISRQFISGAEATKKTLILVGGLLLLSVGGSFIAYKIANRGRNSKPVAGKPAINGPLGGTICPKCKRPFARHWWGLNILVGKYDRCPHCGKWSVTRRVHPDILEASAKAMALAEQEEGKAAAAPANAKDAKRRQLDDSRFTE